MPTRSDDVARVRFARFVDRAVAIARARGMTDQEITRQTGIQASTFHRWRRGEVKSTPKIDKVLAFCVGIGVDVAEALDALGLTGQRDNPAPAPALNPDMTLILRRLHDPNTPAAEKTFIHDYLATLVLRLRRRDEPGPREAG